MINIFNSSVRKCFDLNYLTIHFVSQDNQFELILNAYISSAINNVSMRSIKSFIDRFINILILNSFRLLWMKNRNEIHVRLRTWSRIKSQDRDLSQ